MSNTADIKILKRKRNTQRSNVTRFSKQINDATESTPLEELEHVLCRLQESFKILRELDDSIQDLLDDTEYEADVNVTEKYTDEATRAVQKANKLISNQSKREKSSNTSPHSTHVVPTQITSEVKLPTIKLESFTGDIETWPRFWEQFQSSVDNNSSVSTINKHVFLRGYLDGEPKRLVDGIAITADNYERTKNILNARYGDKNRIIQSHLDCLERIQPALNDSPDALNATYIECHRHIQALAALGENVDVYGRMLAPKVLRAFPDDLCRRWLLHVKRSNLQEGNMSRLMDFLNDEIESALHAQKLRGDSSLPATYTPTAALLHVNTKSGKLKEKLRKQTPEPYCVFCDNRGHWAQECQQITNLQERLDKLKRTNRCFLCLNRGHDVRHCRKRGKVTCRNCKKLHHMSICTREDSLPTSVSKIDVKTPNFTYLQTARIRITGPTGKSKLTRCILDAGSQSSFINSSLVDSLQLTIADKRNLIVKTFESSSIASSSRRQVSFDVKGFSTNASLTISAFESNNTYSPHPPVSQDISMLTSTGKIKLADPKDDSLETPIEVLIGADYYWKIVKMEQPIRLSSSLVLLPTVFGWILSGNRSGTIVNQVTVQHISQLDETAVEPIHASDDAVRQFWELETLGIRESQDRTMTAKDSAILQEFHDSYQIEEGRRVVTLPRKRDVIFTNNLSTATARFYALEERLQRSEDFKAMYHQQMLDYISKEQVELTPHDNTIESVYYLPHHAVKKQKGDNTKYRIVFDASSHDIDSPSLNDALEMGPNLLPEILATLLRFRLFPKAIVCDGSQAFLQLVLNEGDRNLTRFLWYHVERDEQGNCKTTSDVVTYRFTRLPFGLTSSPFLLSATLREVATLYCDKYPLASAVLDKSTFMDDFTASGDDDNNVILLYYQLTALLKNIKLPLAKWATNSEPLKEIWNSEGQEVRSETGVLGVDWNTVKDYIFTDYQNITKSLSEKTGTKRNVLRATAKFYDPLGLFTPVVITAKILFQDLWLRGIDWEEMLPPDLAQRWHSWTKKLQNLSNVHIPRWIGIRNQHDDFEIHVFCDASERAYGSVLYIRAVTNAANSVRLVCSKSRLAPVKKVTLPRLELLAALIGSRLLRYFCSATDFDTSKATMWSDSRVTLGWVKSDPNKWKTFICNRVTEILEYTTPSQWRHCPGTQNPADHLSRGIEADKLCSLDNWWNGPSWLSEERTSWPPDDNSDMTLPEARTVKPQILVVTTTIPLLDVKRYSSYWKLLHVTAWIFRFIQAVKQKARFSRALTAPELHTARNYWVKAVQEECFTKELNALHKKIPLSTSSTIARFNPFLQDGIIRIGGRLQFADLATTEQHPILLHGDHQFTRLLIMETHIRLHHLGVRIVLTELRSEFWIIRARQTIKKCLHTCLPCKIAHNRRLEEIEAPLPSDRVQPTRPFAVTGIDFAGPLYIKFGRHLKKSYIVLFTCSTTRAIHLELATDLSTDRFLMALQRFVGRRGLPHTIYSDNAQTFYAANKELTELFKLLQDSKTQHYCAHHGIVWKFIAPRASWWGGWWERMIGSTKRCLRKILGRSQTDEEGLNTILIGIEAVLNSRPITQETDAETVLTPAHFLNGGKLTTIPDGPEPPMQRDLTKEFRHKQNVTECFWRRWKKEYLLLLRNYHEVRGHKGLQKPRVGDVVLLQADREPRHMWRRALIEELREGRDNKVRGVILRQPDGTRISRPIQLVIPLEIDQGGEDVTA